MMKQTTRPPAQYVVAPGSQFRLVANEYDKNTYSQCSYASQRTLIRCKQIRSKEDLAKNNGRCEEHGDFSKLLESNHKREVQRCHAENDTNMQRRRFDPWIASNEYISDEDDYLQPMQDAPQGIPEGSNDNFLDNHPLRYATHFTDKDVLRIKMDLVQKDIDDLQEFKRLLTAQAQKEHEMLGDDKDEDRPTDMVQRRLFKASSKYSRKDYLTLTTVDPVYKPCCVGPNMDDPTVISHIVQSLLDKIDKVQPIVVEKQCMKPALHLSHFCIDHIRLDRRQKLFDLCSSCGVTAIGGKDPKCSTHLKTQAIAETTKCPCVKCVPPAPPSEAPKEERRIKAEMNSSDEEEALGNLSKFESMVSPMTQFANPYQHSPTGQKPRRYQGAPAQLLRPPQMGPPGAPGVPYPGKRPAASSSQPSLTAQQIQDQQRLKLEEEEIRSQTCSRVRPIDASMYGNGKKKLQQAQNRQQQARNTYQLQPPKKPAITSPPGSAPGGKMTFQGWRNQGTTASQRSIMHQQQGMSSQHHTRYPMHPNRVPPPPKTIPLERIQEHRNPDDSVEDPRRQLPEPHRRGVPYYKAPFRRTDRPPLPTSPLTPSTSTSSSQLLAPPQSPQGSPQIYRNPYNRPPMAPHRAIAAGLNPAEVGGGTAQRPGYRIHPNQRPPFPPSGPHPHQYQSPSGPLLPGARKYVSTRMVAGGGTPRPTGPPGPPGTVVNTITTSYVVQGSSQGPLTSSAPGPSAFSGAPGPSEPEPNVYVDSPRTPPAPRTSEDVNAAASLAGINAMKSLDSARHDARFANVNVKTFFAIANTQDFEKKTKEEIEKLAAQAEIHDKGPRRVSSSGGASGAPGSIGGTPRTSFSHAPPPPPVMPRGNRSSIPRGSAKDQGVPDAVQQVISSMNPPNNAQESGKKRKIEDLSEGEPEQKKQARKSEPKETELPPRTPRTRGSPRGGAAAVAQAPPTPKQPPPSTSTESSATSGGSDENPLDLLAALSAAAEEEEEIQKAGPSTPRAPAPNKKSPNKSPPPRKSTSPSTSSATPTVTRASKRSSVGSNQEES